MSEENHESWAASMRAHLEREYEKFQAQFEQVSQTLKHRQQSDSLFHFIDNGNLQGLQDQQLSESQLTSYTSRWGDNLITAALRQHQWEIADYLLTQAPSFLHSRDSVGRTLLHLAVERPQWLQKLLELGLSVAGEDNYGSTALHSAVGSHSFESVLLLVQAGANIHQKNKQGDNALTLAIGFRRKNLVELWLPHMLETEQTRKECLTKAVEVYDLETIDLLIRPVDLAPPYDDAHLFWALFGSYYGLTEPYAAYLHRMVSQGFDPNAVSISGDPLLYVALQKKNQRAALWLLQKGADPFAVSTQGESVLAFAIQQHNLELLREILPPIQQIEDHIPLDEIMRDLLKVYQPELLRLLLASGVKSQRLATVAWLDQDWYLKQALKMKPDFGNAQLPIHLLLAFQENIKSLGFLLSPQLAARLSTLCEADFVHLCETAVKTLRAMVGAHKRYEPMYPNFPHQVKEMSQAALYSNAFVHYWGDAVGFRWMPAYEKQARPALNESLPEHVIDLGSEDDFMACFTRLQASRTALSAENKAFLAYFIYSRGLRIEPYLHETIPLRENAALVVAAGLRYVPRLKVSRYLSSATDVLRTAVALCHGDVSLAEPTRFQRFPRRWRRFLLAHLEQAPDLHEALARRPERFKRLGEVLHPGDYVQRYPKAYAGFSDLRKGKTFRTYANQVEAALAKAHIPEVLPLLKQRPGDFARRLDHVLRLAKEPEQDLVLQNFSSILSRLPSLLVLQLYTHFACRTQGDWRVFFPKGEVAKLQAIPNTLSPFSEAVQKRILAMCEQQLLADYQQRPVLGKVYVDPALKDYFVPFALRSSSKSLRTIARGSRVQIPPAEVLRFFIWWRDGKARTDLDLSALVLNESFEYVTTLAYYNLKDIGGYHSGDITSAPQGASEFIDIEIDTFLQRQGRYVLMVVQSFTQQPYADLPECFAGFMPRQHPNSGEMYEPRTVLERFDLTAQAKIAIPLIFDLKRREMIWTDLSLQNNPQRSNNVAGNQSSLALLCRAMVNLQRPSLYDLFCWHAQARGERVEHLEGSDIAMTPVSERSQDIKPWDIERIGSEFL